jgi:hypothetical protein
MAAPGGTDIRAEGLGRPLIGEIDLILEGTTSDYAEPPVVGSLRGALATARDIVKGYPVTGWRWKRPPRECPDWCAQDHTCTVRIPGLVGPMSEHRSPVTSWRRPYGSLVATRVQTLDPERGPRVELRTQVRLSRASERLALAQAINLPLVVDHAIQTLLEELEIEARIRALEARRRQLQASRAPRIVVPEPLAVPEHVEADSSAYLPWGTW